MVWCDLFGGFVTRAEGNGLVEWERQENVES